MTNYTDEIMDSSQHPQDQIIQDYLKHPDAAAFDELRLHLAACSYCRRRTEVTAMLREHGHWLEAEPVTADPRVAELLAGKLDPPQAGLLQAEIKQDPSRLRAALHYASHAVAMRELTASPAPQKSIGAGLLSLIKSWLNFEAPLWQMAPVVAVVMTVAILLVNQYYPPLTGDAARIVVFDDNPTLQFASQESQPGIGFFDQGVKSKPFAGVDIELLDGNRLRLSWPEIADANDYNLKIQVFRDGETRLLAKQRLDGNSTELLIDEPLTQHRYEWVLSGDTRDNRSFQSNGGFVVTRN